MMELEKDLKPCPFCGGKVAMTSSSVKKCFTIGHYGLRNCAFFRFEISWDCAKSLAEARTLWNRRTNEKPSQTD